MKRKLIFMLFIVSLFMGITVAKAAGCTYNYQDSFGYNAQILASVDDSSGKATLKKFNNKTYNITSSITDIGDFDGTNCPSFALIYFKKSSIDIANLFTTLKVYLSSDKESLATIQNDNKWTEKNAHIATSSTYLAPNDTQKQYEENIQKEIDAINEIYQSYSLSSCEDTGAVITRIQKCRDIYDSLTIRMNSDESDVNSYITQGFVSADSEVVANFRTTLENARNKWTNVSTELEQEQAKIDAEMGTGQEVHNFSPKDICANKENCNVSLAEFCNKDNVVTTMKFIGYLFMIVKILIPTIIIVVGFVNLFKIITSGKEEDVKKYVKSIVIRIGLGILIFLLPSIIELIYNTANKIITDSETTESSNCVNCILDPLNSNKCVTP